jgi:thiosulfate reductase cytochrome b subunit
MDLLMMLEKWRNKLSLKKLLVAGIIALLILAGAMVFAGRFAQARPSGQATETSSLHPDFPLLDASGENVLESGAPVSTMQTCGACHDTAYIEGHSAHADLGLSSFSAPGRIPVGRAWDSGPGLFGRWDPLLYGYLSPTGDPRLDLGTADWLKAFGYLHVGGGPAVTGRSGEPLVDLPVRPGDPETHVRDPQTGEIMIWDWQASGVAEMNCFLCHTDGPNNPARLEALEAGNFGWASTATLLGSGIVSQSGETYAYNSQAFTADGNLSPEALAIQDPTEANCSLCHAPVQASAETPFVKAGCDAEQLRAERTGTVFSAGRLSASGVNLAGKEDLSRSWDIHAERGVSCTDCHFSLNNPVYFQESGDTRPEHLSFDPRRLEIGEYLYRPSHLFAGSPGELAGAQNASQEGMRRCEDCHNTAATHTWLPYQERHMEAVSCETCHIPKVYSSALQQLDWTVIRPEASPQVECRGTDGENGSLTALIIGYTPTVLPGPDASGETRLAPFNLGASWYWMYGDPPRPVPLSDLQSAWIQDGAYHPDVLSLFDRNGDGALDGTELRLDSQEKVELIAARLEAGGLEAPRIAGEVQPYRLSHGVASGEWATRDCQTCHSQASSLTQAFKLASYIPGGVLPAFTPDSRAAAEGKLYESADGALYYQPQTGEAGLYVLGLDKAGWIDILGSLLFTATLLGVAAHGTFRFLSALRRPAAEQQVEKVYIYAVYERLWHWLQTFTILGLIFTGLVIHKPDTFGIFSFRYVVLAHNILAAILLVNAALSLFYHLASGEIRQFIPRPAGFFDQAIAQAVFYVRGIFKGERHPFEKTPERKLNPLQQATYFAILNLLLPLQVITGGLMWGTQRWPEISARLGGLTILAPFHTLIAWLFAAFIVLHIYLTTTGHAPLTGLKAMMDGWEVIESHRPVQEETAS